MKKFILKLLAFVLILVIILAALCVVIDPFNVFHPLSIRNNGVEPNKNYIKTCYILSEPDKFNSFVFGASNVGNLHTDKMPGSCYNMTYSSGFPDEYLETLRTFIENGIIPDKIYVGLSNLSFSGKGEYHLDDPMRSPYWYAKEHPFKFWKMYLNPATVGSSVIEVMAESQYNKDSIAVFYDYGWNYDYNYVTTYDFGDNTPEEQKAELDGTIIEGTRLPYEGMLEKLEEMIALCNENNIELEFFMVPFYYGQQLDDVYIEYLQDVAEITPFWNFCGYNDIVFDSANYIDYAHYNAEVGDMIINCMCYGERYDDLYEDGFGMYVTEDNVGELIEKISGTEHN